jgi:hypothetical protein
VEVFLQTGNAWHITVTKGCRRIWRGCFRSVAGWGARAGRLEDVRGSDRRVFRGLERPLSSGRLFLGSQRHDPMRRECEVWEVALMPSTSPGRMTGPSIAGERSLASIQRT